MITLKIDKTSFNKKDLILFLEELMIDIDGGREIGEDWDIEGKEEEEIIIKDDE